MAIDGQQLINVKLPPRNLFNLHMSKTLIKMIISYRCGTKAKRLFSFFFIRNFYLKTNVQCFDCGLITLTQWQFFCFCFVHSFVRSFGWCNSASDVQVEAYKKCQLMSVFKWMTTNYDHDKVTTIEMMIYLAIEIGDVWWFVFSSFIWANDEQCVVNEVSDTQIMDQRWNKRSTQNVIIVVICAMECAFLFQLVLV